MKGKKYKKSQSNVKNLYEKYFGIRKPYQIIVDAPFCIETLKIKVAPPEALTEVFGGVVKLMTTPCIQAELIKHDRINDSGTAFVAKRFEVRRCQHDKGSKSGSECIADLIGTDNPNHYCIASQDLELRKTLRKIPGVPLIFILRDTVLMEPPTEKCLQIAHKLEQQKLKKVNLKVIKMVTDSIISKANPADAISENNSTATTSKTIKKKKSKKFGKSPNPLSCKKPKKLSTNSNISASSTNTTTDTNSSKKPRKRRPKKKATTSSSTD